MGIPIIGEDGDSVFNVGVIVQALGAFVFIHPRGFTGFKAG